MTDELIEYDVEISGPAFNGGTKLDVGAAFQAGLAASGQAGVELIQKRLSSNLRNPTGYYESQISTQRSVTGYDITDGDVIYGAWLEGTSSRNEISRFKGYGSIRKARIELQALAPKLVTKFVDRAV